MKNVIFEKLGLDKFKPVTIEKLGCIKGGYDCATGGGSMTTPKDGGGTITISYSADTSHFDDKTGKQTGSDYHTTSDKSNAPKCEPKSEA